METTGTILPSATVIVPVKGEDEGLKENLAALADLDYPDYELLVVARAEGDIPPGAVPQRARVVIAGNGDPGTGEKINNLLAAVAAARPESDLLAFADSDGRSRPRWLRALAAGLEEKDIGAATGYRWHLPEPADFWSLMRSVWNGVIAGEFGPGPVRFAWGGAMAVRRETFEQARVAEFWRGSVSDDYMLTAAVRAAGLQVIYEPGALVVSTDHTRAGEFFQWMRRQLIITRIYEPRLWALALAAHAVYCGALVASAAIVATGHIAGAGALAAQLGLGMWKGRNRLRLARLSLPEYREWFDRHGWAHVLLVPLVTWVWLCGLLMSATTNTIEWRGTRYRLRAGTVERV